MGSEMCIRDRFNVGFSIVEGWWMDTGKKDDILNANALILDEKIERNIKGEIVNSKVEGRVTVEKGAKIVNSTIRGPAIIGMNCYIQDSFIRPYTSVGNEARIINSSLEYCIILENAIVEDIDRLEESLIGRDAKVIKNARKTVRLNIGDYSEVEI